MKAFTVNRFRNIGMRTRLIGGFAAMVALASACGITGVLMANQFENDTTALLDGPVAEIAQANDAWEQILQAQYYQQQFKNTKSQEAADGFSASIAQGVAELNGVQSRTSNQA
jgi:hypothetical protein